jgi:uncharacterized spore protein YtfJ
MSKQVNKVNNIINEALIDLKDTIKDLTIIGEPIILSDDVSVIPVSKTLFGYVNGGSEFGDIKLFQPSSNGLIGGSGGVVNVTPYGFLIVKNQGYEFIKIKEDMVDKVTDFTNDMVSKILGKNQNEKV